MSYPGSYTPALTARSFSRGGTYPQSPYTPRSTPGYDEYSRYPYGEPVKGQYDDSPASYTGYGDDIPQDSYQQTPQQSYRSPAAPYASSYATPRLSGYYGNGAYDDLALNRSSYYGKNDYDYTSYNAGALTHAPRPRRSSSVSFHHQLSTGQQGYYESFNYRNRTPSVIKLRVKGSLRSGMSLADAVSGVKLSGGDYVKWHEINADARGRIYLRVKWNGYPALTYEIPVDGYDNRVRLSSLARRVARACIHFMQANSIPISWDRVKLYHLEETSYGVWQPALTVR